VDFAPRDERVRKVTIASVRASEPATLKITLGTSDHRTIDEATFALERDHAIEIERVTADGARASRLNLELTSASRARVSLTDLRVQGQTPALERYIAGRLRFPAR
jgi:hypothetical protein